MSANNLFLGLVCVLAVFSASVRADDHAESPREAFPLAAARAQTSCPMNDVAQMSELTEQWRKTRTLQMSEIRQLQRLVVSVPYSCQGNLLYTDALTALRWMGVLACPPEQIKNRVSIVLTSEVHDDPESDRYFRENYRDVQMPGEQRYFVAETGTGGFNRVSLGPLLGKVTTAADGTAAHAVHRFWLVFRSLLTKKPLQASDFMLEVLSNPAMIDAWKKTPRPLSSAPSEQIAAFLDRAIDVTRNASYQQIQATVHTMGGSAPMTPSTLTTLGEALFKELSKPPAGKSIDFFPDLKGQTLKQTIEDPKFSGFDEMLRARDLNLRSNAGDVLCRTAGQKKVKIVVNGGGMHTPGEFQELQQMLVRSGVADKVDLKVDAKFLDFQFLTQYRLFAPEFFNRMMKQFAYIPRQNMINRSAFPMAEYVAAGSYSPYPIQLNYPSLLSNSNTPLVRVPLQLGASGGMPTTVGYMMFRNPYTATGASLNGLPAYQFFWHPEFLRQRL